MDLSPLIRAERVVVGVGILLILVTGIVVGLTFCVYQQVAHVKSIPLQQQLDAIDTRLRILEQR